MAKQAGEQKEPDQGRRLILLGLGGTVLAGLVAQRLVKWQVLESDNLAAEAGVQQRNEELVAAHRGEIRSADGAVLALTQQVDRLAASPDLLAKLGAGAAVEQVARILNTSPETVMLKITDPQIKDPWKQKYAVLAGAIEPEQSAAVRQAVEAKTLKGVYLEATSRRVYPNGALASHVVGFVNGDGMGQSGVEAFYDEVLSGRPGRLISDQDPSGKNIPVGRYDPLPPEDGATLVLTLDRTIQHIVDQELEQALAKFGSTGGTIIVMNPRNGDVLALANRPTYNPAKLSEYSFIGLDFLNAASSLIFDPGSTFKIITMAAGLDAGVIKPYSTHNVPGVYKYWGLEFKNWDEHSYPNQTMVSVLANSSNTGAIYVADRTGPERFYDYVRAFGFGRPTGIDVAGEVAGIVKARGSQEWYPSDLAANSFGQSISVTAIQLASAFGAVANGGILMRPRVLKKIVHPSGRIEEREAKPVRRVLREATAQTLMDMMFEAEHMIPVNLALNDEHSTVGKTGTAEIPDRGGILPEQTIASYVGFGPRINPQILVLVKIDRPQRGTWGSQVASPVFRSVVERVFYYLRVKSKGQG